MGSTWEPVGQEQLEHLASDCTRADRVAEERLVGNLAAELLAARALLVALVEANDKVRSLEPEPADAQAFITAVGAIRAHVRKVQGAA